MTVDPSVLEQKHRHLPVLPDRTKQVVDHYLATKKKNKSGSYRAIYQCKRNSAHRGANILFKRQDVREYIRIMDMRVHGQAMEKYEVTVDRIYEEMTKLAYYNIKDFYDEDGVPIPVNKLDPTIARAVMGVKADGSYILPDKGTNLERLAKTLGMFKADAKAQSVVVVQAPVIVKPDESGT